MHYVLIASSDLKEGGTIFIDQKSRSKPYTTISDRGFAKLQDGDTLYLSTHGIWSESTGRSTGEIQKGSQDLDAAATYKWLCEKKLPNRAFKLKIFACFSAGRTTADGRLQENLDETFAGKLSALMRVSHSKVTVYGYINEVMFSNQMDGHKTGGRQPNTDLARRASQARVQFNSDGTTEQRWM